VPEALEPLDVPDALELPDPELVPAPAPVDAVLR
jgi:hypothetical protein